MFSIWLMCVCAVIAWSFFINSQLVQSSHLQLLKILNMLTPPLFILTFTEKKVFKILKGHWELRQSSQL